MFRSRESRFERSMEGVWYDRVESSDHARANVVPRGEIHILFWSDPMTTVAPAADDGTSTSATRLPVADRPPRTAPTSGLYDPRFEHDACGLALVADLHGRPTHTLVLQAISALEHLAHRGATGSEEDSGDGAGILIQVPDDFYRQVVDFTLPERGSYATGIAFLSADEPSAAEARSNVERLAGEEGLVDQLGAEDQ